MADEVSNAEVPKKEKYFADQFDDEEVLFVFRKHPIVMRKGLVFGMIGPLLGVLPTAVKPTLGFGYFFGGLGIGLLLGLLIFFPFWIGWYFSVFIITDQRLIQINQKGLFHRSVSDMGLAQIQQVNYSVDGLQATLLGFGTITMLTYVGELVIHYVHHPAKTQRKIVEILRDHGVAAAAYPTGQNMMQEHEIKEA